jgi:hypothetical protein
MFNYETKKLMGDYMKRNFWCWWIYRPTEDYLKSGKIKELFMDVDSMWGMPNDINETKDYIKLCKKHKIPLYFRVNCFASSLYTDILPNLTLDEVKKDIKDRIDRYTSLGVHIALDYIRNKGWTKYVVTRDDIREIVDYAYSKDKKTKAAVFEWFTSKFYGQYYSDFKKITIMPMVYGGSRITELNLWFHKTFFPTSVICIKGFETTKETIDRHCAIVGNERAAIWRWHTYKELMK